MIFQNQHLFRIALHLASFILTLQLLLFVVFFVGQFKGRLTRQKESEDIFWVCYLALVMERVAYYRIRQVGLDLSSQKVIELLA